MGNRRCTSSPRGQPSRVVNHRAAHSAGQNAAQSSCTRLDYGIRAIAHAFGTRIAIEQVGNGGTVRPGEILCFRNDTAGRGLILRRSSPISCLAEPPTGRDSMDAKFVTQCSHCATEMTADTSRLGTYGRCHCCRQEFRLTPVLARWARRDALRYREDGSQPVEVRSGRCLRGILASWLRSHESGDGLHSLHDG